MRADTATSRRARAVIVSRGGAYALAAVTGHAERTSELDGEGPSRVLRSCNRESAADGRKAPDGMRARSRNRSVSRWRRPGGARPDTCLWLSCPGPAARRFDKRRKLDSPSAWPSSFESALARQPATSTIPGKRPARHRESSAGPLLPPHLAPPSQRESAEETNYGAACASTP